MISTNCEQSSLVGLLVKLERPNRLGEGKRGQIGGCSNITELPLTLAEMALERRLGTVWHVTCSYVQLSPIQRHVSSLPSNFIINFTSI